ncbi:MAG: hypothetical protein ACREAB_12705 [Blastocatellia bacterium]
MAKDQEEREQQGWVSKFREPFHSSCRLEVKAMENTLTEEMNPENIAAIKAAIDEGFEEIRRIRAEMRSASEQMARDQEEIEQLRKETWAYLERVDLELRGA